MVIDCKKHPQTHEQSVIQPAIWAASIHAIPWQNDSSATLAIEKNKVLASDPWSGATVVWVPCQQDQ